MLVIVAKSPWSPAIRREHALARIAQAQGENVVFVERSRDVRRALTNPRAWHAGLSGSSLAVEGLVVVRRSALAPAHRARVFQWVETAQLTRILQNGFAGSESSIVATAPWQWPAVARTRAARRVFDCADDWTRLLPHAAPRLAAMYRRAGREADAITVAHPRLAALFDGAVTVVPNACDEDLVRAPVSPAATMRMVYAGTLSERFDVDLVRQVLERLPGWSLDIHGQCQYAGFGERPSPELAALLNTHETRVRWHGVAPRSRLADALDRATVLVLPHRTEGAVDGDAMKLYDYAARGRPIVSTAWARDLASAGPPHLRIADGPDVFARQVLEGAAEPASRDEDRRQWAMCNTWLARWSTWRVLLVGSAADAAAEVVPFTS